jgi:hypothetical protein
MSLFSELAATDSQVRSRLREYREEGYQRNAMPHILFRPAHHGCPWVGCDHLISGIDFQLELMGDDQAYHQWMNAWWKGPGLVGRCPGCGQYVLFTMEKKLPVEDPKQFEGAILADDWHQYAYLLP